MLVGQNGTCQHQYDLCDDGDACTLDKCDPDQGCVNLKIANCGQPCEDPALDCSADTTCLKWGCGPVSAVCIELPVLCDDGDPCTADVCQEQAGGCSSLPIPKCGNACVNDIQCQPDNPSQSPCQEVGCVDGFCAELPICDDGDPCTLDICNPEGDGCSQKPNPACF